MHFSPNTALVDATARFCSTIPPSAQMLPDRSYSSEGRLYISAWPVYGYGHLPNVYSSQRCQSASQERL